MDHPEAAATPTAADRRPFREVELKLFAPPSSVSRLWSHALIVAHATGPLTAVRIDNRYYDTADGALAAARLGLRVRRIGRRWMQTLKAAGDGDGVVSMRDEWEMPIDGPTLELARLSGTPLDAFGPASELAARLKPMFTTNFRRETRMLRLADGSVVEFALDVGTIVAGKGRARRSSPICEVEIEVRANGPAGPPDLLRLAARLAADVALIPLAESKAERGRRLAAGVPVAPVRVDLPAAHAGDAASVALAAVLSRCNRALAANAHALFALSAATKAAMQAAPQAATKAATQAAPPVAAGRSTTGKRVVEPAGTSHGARSDPRSDDGDRDPNASDGPAGDAVEEAVEAAVEAAVADAAIETLHQARVAIRRMRSALQLFAPAIGGRRADELDRALRTAGRHFGAARDRDVLLTATARRLDDVVGTDAEGRAALVDVRDAVQAARIDAHRALMRYLDAGPFGATIIAVDRAAARWMARPRGKPVADRASAWLSLQQRRVVRRSRRIAALDDDERHGLRIEVKRLRYALDLLETLYEEPLVDDYRDALAELQEKLGRMTDATAAGAVLASLPETATTLLVRARLETWLRRSVRKQLPKVAALAVALELTPSPWFPSAADGADDGAEDDDGRGRAGIVPRTAAR